jgi:hypothetical protein
MREPIITINGTTLTEAQAMTVRVSVTHFQGRIDRPEALGEDETGEAIRQGYLARSTEIISMMLTPSPSTHVAWDETAPSREYIATLKEEIERLRDTLNEATKERDHLHNQWRACWAPLTPRSENEKQGFERVLAILKSKLSDGGGIVGPSEVQRAHNDFYRGRRVAFEECATMLRAALATTEDLSWSDPATAPKDGTMLHLLIRPGQEELDAFTSFHDSREPYETIGFNQLKDTLEDVWQFAGWDWYHDCITDGHGEVIGWRPFGSANPAPQPREVGSND